VTDNHIETQRNSFYYECTFTNHEYCTAVADPGGREARAPLFLAKSIQFFYIVYNVWKNIFEIEFVFYSGRNPRSFWKCGGVCVCVWIEIVATTVFCSAKAQFWMISEAILILKIYAKVQEIASNFLKFSGGGPPYPPPALAPSALGSGFRPLTGPLISKIPGSAPAQANCDSFNLVFCVCKVCAFYVHYLLIA